jgi:ABC-type transport system involved in multi-copper enzyme maturation permease subunit
MIRTIIKKEILENILSYKFTIIILLSTVLILTSIFIMVRDYELRIENYDILGPETDDATALVKPTALSVFAKGLDENLCRSYQIRFGGQILVGSKQQSVNAIFSLFNTPDLLFIIKVIMALCALLFAFDRISGEKDSGTLKLILANHLKRPSVILGKWIGGFTSLIIPFIAAILLGTIIMTLSSAIDLKGDDWGRLILFLISGILYMAIFFSLGLFISAVTHRASSSLVISLFVWSLLIFVLPNLGNILAKQLTKIPSVQQLEVQRQHIWIKEVFDRIHGRVEPDKFEGNINRENDMLMENYRNKFGRLVTLSKNITRLSPASAFTFLATDLAGTGLLEERNVKTAILQYKNQVFGKNTDSDGNIIGSVPEFSYRRIPLSDVLNLESLGNFAILFMFNLLFISAAYVAFLKYDAR